MTLDIDIPFFELHVNVSRRSVKKLSALAAAAALVVVYNKTK